MGREEALEVRDRIGAVIHLEMNLCDREQVVGLRIEIVGIVDVT